jgi:hypothetical protein
MVAMALGPAILAGMSASTRPLDGTCTVSAGVQPESPRSSATFVCDVCGRTLEGMPAGSGLFIWTRGEEVRYENPPLCDECAPRVTVAALGFWDHDEDEG